MIETDDLLIVEQSELQDCLSLYCRALLIKHNDANIHTNPHLCMLPAILHVYQSLQNRTCEAV